MNIIKNLLNSGKNTALFAAMTGLLIAHFYIFGDVYAFFYQEIN
tara:strand:+ start:1647 stop:1778 length:132 start_codon:yes stop_codon:yes gene_type:complete